MAEQYSFYRSDIGGSIIIRERSAGMSVSSDPCAQVWLGQDYEGVTYEEMFKAGSGVIEVDDEGTARIPFNTRAHK